MIEISGLEKRFGQKTVLDGLTMEVPDGALFGLIGPNGAGKTTTMRILAGLLQPDAGSVTIGGLELSGSSERIRRRLGYMPDFFGVYDDLRVSEYMEFFADIYGIPAKEQRKRIDGLLEAVHLEDRKDDFVDTLSRGMKQKLCLARALVHKPDVLLLDEPASGMEPAARMELRGILRQLSEDGTTIVISSHLLSELSLLCTDIGILESGRLLLCGSKNEILRQAAKNAPIQITVADDGTGSAGAEEAVRLLKRRAEVKDIARDRNVISASVEGGERTEAELLSYLVEHHVPVSAYRRQEGSLEALFLKLTASEP